VQVNFLSLHTFQILKILIMNNNYKFQIKSIAKFLCLLTSLLSSIQLFGQQELILTKYTYNSMFFNPAYAGSHGYGEGSVVAHYRNQWLSLEGAPKTIMIGAESSLAKNRLGVGLGIVREQIGVESRTDVTANTAYRIKLSKGFLAGGLRASFQNFSNDFTKLKIKDGGDVSYLPNTGFNLFNIGTGLYYNNDGFYVGFAVPTLAVLGSTKAGIGDRALHMYIHTGMMIGDEYSSIKFEPSLLVKRVTNVPLQFTLGVNAWFSEDFAIGAHFRSQDALALSSEFHFAKNYRIAVAYDFTLSEIKKYSDGSLELLLGYRFNSSPNDPKVKNLRHGGRF
jgi:type IX secretion system PorP/SprF family membrane protein